MLRQKMIQFPAHEAILRNMKNCSGSPSGFVDVSVGEVGGVLIPCEAALLGINTCSHNSRLIVVGVLKGFYVDGEHHGALYFKALYDPESSEPSTMDVSMSLDLFDPPGDMRERAESLSKKAQQERTKIPASEFPGVAAA